MGSGRPTKFEERFCDMLIEHMSNGLSFESFAAVVKVNRDTIYHWEKLHPIFSDAKKIAREKCLMFWESQGIEGLWSTRGKLFNSAVWIYNMKSRFPDQWMEKSQTEVVGTPIQIKIDSDDSKL